MTYSVKEIFYTLQGEGANAGTPAVFCRFSGCNLWSGREADRATAICKFCDTEFVGTDGLHGGRFKYAEALADTIEREWLPSDRSKRFVVLTGGEPALQIDRPLIDELHKRDFRIAIETNGTVDLVPGIDWICVSPKANTELKVHSGSELKVVYPQVGMKPAKFEHLRFQHFFLSPMDGPLHAQNTARAIEYCQHHPRWRLSVQTHKYISIR